MMEREELKSYLNQLIKSQSIGEVKSCWLPLLEKLQCSLLQIWSWCVLTGHAPSSISSLSVLT